MRLAGRFARRVRAWGEAHGVPVIDCDSGVRKHEIAEQYLAEHPDLGRGVIHGARGQGPGHGVAAGTVQGPERGGMGRSRCPGIHHGSPDHLERPRIRGSRSPVMGTASSNGCVRMRNVDIEPRRRSTSSPPDSATLLKVMDVDRRRPLPSEWVDDCRLGRA